MFLLDIPPIDPTRTRRIVRPVIKTIEETVERGEEHSRHLTSWFAYQFSALN